MKVCLVIIAKNESHVIGRALESAKNFVDYVCVVDTGSTADEYNAMLKIVDDVYPDGGYQIHKDPWIDFATNRTNALRLAEEQFPDADWLFMMDADDYITQMTFIEAGLNKGLAGYNVLVKSEDIAYPRTQIFRADGSWRYRGVVHEFPERGRVPQPAPVGTYPITIRSTREGDRNRDVDKYRKDARLLEDALRADTIELDLVPRYTFYLAQSYDAAGEPAKASEMYMKRADMHEGYTEERYVSLLRNMRLMEIFDYDPDEVYRMAITAQAICPQRREVVALAMHLLNDASCHRLSMDLWDEFPTDGTVPTGLFIEPDVYTHLLFDRAAVASHYCGAYKKALRLNTLALKGHPNMPLDMKRIADNMRWSIDAL